MTTVASPTLKLNVKRKDGPVFIADLDQLIHWLKAPTRRKLVLGGQLTMASLEPLKAQAEFVPQPARAIKSRLFFQPKASRKLHLTLDKVALEQMVKAKCKPVLAVDALLKYGLKLKGPDEHCVIGAIESSTSTQVLTLVFRKQELVSYSEYQLAHSAHNTYEADIHILLERLSQSAAGKTVFHWCGPVTPPRAHTFTLPDPSFWATASTVALTGSGRPSILRRHGIALVLVTTAVLAYAGALYQPYQAYAHARNNLLQESQSLKGETAFNAERLVVLRSRQALFEKHKRAELRFSKFVDVLTAFAQEPGLSVTNAVLISNTDPTTGARTGRAADFEISVQVPRLPGFNSILDQGRPLLQSLSARTGANLRLATGGDGYRDALDGKGPTFRLYKIQGDFTNAN